MRINEKIIVCIIAAGTLLHSCGSLRTNIVDSSGLALSQATNDQLVERNERLNDSLSNIEDAIERAKDSARQTGDSIESALDRLDQLERIISDITRELEKLRAEAGGD